MHSPRYHLDHGIPSLVCTWLPYHADPYVQITDVGVSPGWGTSRGGPSWVVHGIQRLASWMRPSRWCTSCITDRLDTWGYLCNSIVSRKHASDCPEGARRDGSGSLIEVIAVSRLVTVAASRCPNPKPGYSTRQPRSRNRDL